MHQNSFVFETIFLFIHASTVLTNGQMKLKGEKTGRKGHLSVVTEVYHISWAYKCRGLAKFYIMYTCIPFITGTSP
jgi:hypothetical protein